MNQRTTNVRQSSRVRQSSSGFARLHRGSPVFAGVRRGAPGFAGVRRGSPVLARARRSPPGFAWVRLGSPGIAGCVSLFPFLTWCCHSFLDGGLLSPVCSCRFFCLKREQNLSMSCRLTFSVDCLCNGMNKNNKHGTSPSLGGVLLSLSSLVAFVASSSVDGGDV